MVSSIHCFILARTESRVIPSRNSGRAETLATEPTEDMR